MVLDGPDALDRFVSELRADLERCGWGEAAARLGAVQRTAFTTGSEWLGELGAAAAEVRARHALPAELAARLAVVEREARRVWPALRGA